MGDGQPTGRGYRAAVAGRVLLAIVGSYVFASLATVLLSLTLPLERAEAVIAATLLSFVLIAFIVMVVFAARSLRRAVVGLALPTGVLGIGVWLLLRWGAPA